MNFKKLILLFIPLLFVLGFFASSFVAADTFEVMSGCTMVRTIDIGNVHCSGTIDVDADPEKGICCVINTILKATDLIFAVLVVASSLMIAYGGFLIVTSQGSDDAWEKGKKIITYAIIGLIIAILSKVIPGVALALL